MSFSRNRYIMDDPREAERLRDKADSENWVRKFVLPHLSSACRVVEFGCGPGEFIHAICRAVPALAVAGVDCSPERVRVAQERNRRHAQAEFLCRDAKDTGLATNSCDVVFCRFMLEYVLDKQGAVNEMFRVCRPGGKVILQDLDGQLLWHDPIDPALQADVERVLNSLATTGFDPFIGRKLRRLARQAGFANVEVAIEPYHLIAGSINETDRSHWQAKLDIAQPLISNALGSEIASSRLIQAMMAFFDDPETLTYSNLFTITGEKAG